MATDVSVYNPGGSFIHDLGQTVLPADIKPMDFSSLDKALATENDLSSKAIDVMTKNVDAIGKIQDELTGIQTPLPSQQAALEAKKKAYGIDDATFKQAANNIDNPMALYQIDRNLKKLYTDPVVKDIMRDNALLDAYKDGIPKIEDPNMRATAISAIAKLSESTDPNAIKNLNIDQYKTVDLEDSYTQMLDKFAPYTSTSEEVSKDGTTYTQVTTKRDPDMVKRTKEYFQKNPTIKNNLIAKGYIDEDGNPVGTWFEDMDKAQSQTTTQIKDVKGATGGYKGGSSATPAGPYTPNVTEDGIDLGVTGSVATDNASADPVESVHADPAPGAGINIGKYNFNIKEGAGMDYINFLEDELAPDCTADSTYCDLIDNLKKVATENNNVDAVKAAYKAIETQMGGPDKLAKAEDAFAAQKIGTPMISSAADILGPDYNLSSGEKTMLFDAAVEHEQPAVEKWLNDYASETATSHESLIEFIAKKRAALIDELIKKGSINPTERYSRLRRIDVVRQRALAIDTPQQSTAAAAAAAPQAAAQDTLVVNPDGTTLDTWFEKPTQ